MITTDKEYFGLSKLKTTICIAPNPKATDLRVGIINLMQDKRSTEAPWFQVLSEVEQDLHISFFRLPDYEEPLEHRAYFHSFYNEATPKKIDKLDVIIVTGLPAGGFEHPFLDFPNWAELAKVFDEAKSRGIPVLGSCWAGYALLFHRYDLMADKYEKKHLGLFRQNAFPCMSNPEFSAYLPQVMSVARRLNLPTSHVQNIPELDVHWGKDDTGIFLATDNATRDLFIHSHVECGYGYARAEYENDVRNEIDFVGGDIPFKSKEAEQAALVWQASGRILMRDWFLWHKSSCS
jgi:homoserine O-succinyltransferase